MGPNGAGKTSLLEAVHLGTQGFSQKTRREATAIRFGAETTRVAVRGALSEGGEFRSEVTIRRGGGKEIRLDGAPAESIELLRRRLPVLAFTPDRLAVVKGAPVVRRTYLDRLIGRTDPPRAVLPGEYATALAQRNTALRRARAGLSSAAAVAPWTEAVARLGGELDGVRAGAVAALAPCFARRAAALGLEAAALAYARSGVTVEQLVTGLGRDLERGTTGAGPHLADAAITAGGRELRTFGSQGEQRLAVLALLLGEVDLFAEQGREAPLLLLDDVLSELDEERRRALLRGLPAGAQTLVTATTLRSLPEEGSAPSLVLEVSAGRVTAR